MQGTIAIDRLSRAEKLRVMEAIWEDLSREDSLTESPAWHKNALAETERRRKAGQVQVLDWDDAKAKLRKRRG